MKRMMALLLACVMLAVPFTASAADGAVTVTVGSVQGAVGDTVEVPVSVSDGHYLVNGRIFITYDPTALELQAVSDDADNPYVASVNTAILDSSAMWMSGSPEAGKVNFVFVSASDTGSAVGGVLYTLSFKLLKETDSAALAVTVKELNANSGGEDYAPAFTAVNGSVAVTAPTTADKTPVLKGDVNGDGFVNIADVTRLFYYLNGKLDLTAQQLLNGDINDDGTVKLADANRLFYYTGGLSDL